MPNSHYVYATIPQLHAAFRERKLTVRELVLSFLLRISEIDRCENGLNAVLEVNPDALFIADALDKKLQSGGKTGPLFGIPVFVKDNINTADRLHTSAGSVALKNNYASYDAYIVKKLREADAVILGKANMTEFANFMTDGQMPSGYSSRGGQVINPHNREKTPSGSSSGSAVAVAAGLCTAAIGTETCGSIVSPAGQNGIVGIKPTIGLVGRSGIVPISSTLDTAGPMTRTVEDAAILLGVISGVDPGDAATGAQPEINYIDRLKKDGISGIRIGIYHPRAQQNLAFPGERKEMFNCVCRLLSDAGAILVENIEIDLNCDIGKIMHYEFKASMNYYLSTLNGHTDAKTLGDITAYNETYAKTALRYGQSNFIEIENNTSGSMTEPEYLQALVIRETGIYEFERIFSEYGVDVVLCETFNNIFAQYTGFPSMVLPVGQRQDQLPVDCYLMARRYDEATLLKVAYAIEQRLGLSLRPQF